MGVWSLLLKATWGLFGEELFVWKFVVLWLTSNVTVIVDQYMLWLTSCCTALLSTVCCGGRQAALACFASEFVKKNMMIWLQRHHLSLVQIRRHSQFLANWLNMWGIVQELIRRRYVNLQMRRQASTTMHYACVARRCTLFFFLATINHNTIGLSIGTLYQYKRMTCTTVTFSSSS